ncbi:MAG: cytochrome c3 family protein [Actinomycetota bacterium]
MQTFPPSADTWLRLVVLAALLALVLGGAAVAGLIHSDWLDDTTLPPPQPVPFSHRHHAGALGLDCRYCHTSVETSSEAGLPPTHICMTCHSQLFTGQEMLAPVRHSLASGIPIPWRRVAKLPGYVYFNHSIHVAKGVGCADCHGRIDRMAATFKAHAFKMQWCLGCHRDPGPHLRPLDKVTDMDWQPPPDQDQEGRRLVAERHIEPHRITDCYTCHR